MESQEKTPRNLLNSWVPSVKFMFVLNMPSLDILYFSLADRFIAPEICYFQQYRLFMIYVREAQILKYG